MRWFCAPAVPGIDLEYDILSYFCFISRSVQLTTDLFHSKSGCGRMHGAKPAHRQRWPGQRIENLLSYYPFIPLSRKAMTYTGLLGIVAAAYVYIVTDDYA